MTLIASNRLVLPGVPEVAQRVRHMAGDPDTSLASIATIAAQDPTFAAHLIKVSNSVALHRGGNVRSLHMAIARLGAQLTAVTATSFCIMQMMAMLPGHVTRLRILYRHSVEIGERCHNLAGRHPHLVQEDALLAGLVHDIGVPVVLQYLRSRPKLQPQQEDLIGALHAQVGAALLQAWHFQPHIVDAVAAHEDWTRGKPSDPPDYADLLIAANLATHRGSRHPMATLTDAQVPALARLDLLNASAAETPAESSGIQHLCGLTPA